MDINAKFHALRFKDFYKRVSHSKSLKDYGDILAGFEEASRKVYSENNRGVVVDKPPELLSEMLDIILKAKPDIVAFSIVYSSQCFYTRALIDELKKQGIGCVAGGPAVNSKIRERCTCLNNEVELLDFILSRFKDEKGDVPKIFKGSEFCCRITADFSDYDKDDYLSKEMIIPLKTSSSCYYRQCAFCTHYSADRYFEYDLHDIKESIVKSEAKNVFFIDDMISKPRLLAIAKMIKPLKVKWWCQLRPTKDLIGSFEELHDSGLAVLAWGVESGNQRVLNLIKKGTKVEDMESVLRASHDAGIKNIVYLLFGFPIETKDEFLDTIDFIKRNDGCIDLVSTSIFGLQKGSKVFKEPCAFGITGVESHKRTVLDDRFTYKVERGMDSEEAKKMRNRYIKTIKKIDKMPRVVNAYKEQALLFC
jgi:hypothetical protein